MDQQVIIADLERAPHPNQSEMREVSVAAVRGNRLAGIGRDDHFVLERIRVAESRRLAADDREDRGGGGIGDRRPRLVFHGERFRHRLQGTVRPARVPGEERQVPVGVQFGRRERPDPRAGELHGGLRLIDEVPREPTRQSVDGRLLDALTGDVAGRASSAVAAGAIATVRTADFADAVGLALNFAGLGVVTAGVRTVGQPILVVVDVVRAIADALRRRSDDLDALTGDVAGRASSAVAAGAIATVRTADFADAVGLALNFAGLGVVTAGVRTVGQPILVVVDVVRAIADALRRRSDDLDALTGDVAGRASSAVAAGAIATVRTADPSVAVWSADGGRNASAFVAPRSFHTVTAGPAAAVGATAFAITLRLADRPAIVGLGRAFVRPPGHIIPGVVVVVPAVCREKFPSIAARDREEGAKEKHQNRVPHDRTSEKNPMSSYLRQDARPAEGCSRDISREKQ